MRLCYLALDRPDLQFPSKELRDSPGILDDWCEFVGQIEEPSHVVV